MLDWFTHKVQAFTIFTDNKQYVTGHCELAHYVFFRSKINYMYCRLSLHSHRSASTERLGKYVWVI